MSQQAVRNEIPLKTVLGMVKLMRSCNVNWVDSKAILLPSKSSSLVQDAKRTISINDRMLNFFIGSC